MSGSSATCSTQAMIGTATARNAATTHSFQARRFNFRRRDCAGHRRLAREENRLSTAPAISAVDDDASVRAATGKFLRSHGYTVQAYSSA
jgi:hypothetical protein